MTKGLKYLIVAGLMLVCFYFDASAQPLPPSSSTPLDPLSWVLLAGAGAFAGKKLYDSKNRKGQ